MNKELMFVVVLASLLVPVAYANAQFSSSNQNLLWDVSVVGYEKSYFKIYVNVTNIGTEDVMIGVWNFYAKTESNHQITCELLHQTTFDAITTLHSGMWTDGIVAFEADETDDPVVIVGYDNGYSIDEELWIIPEFGNVFIVFLVVSISFLLIGGLRKRNDRLALKEG